MFTERQITMKEFTDFLDFSFEEFLLRSQSKLHSGFVFSGVF